MNVYFKLCSNIWNSDATCSCAVFVQSGDDVIVIDSCGPRAEAVGTMTVTIFNNGPLTRGTRILSYNGRTKYKVGGVG